MWCFAAVYVLFWTAEDDAYEYCDDFEEYTPEQVRDDIFSPVAIVDNTRHLL